jgi:hypothetical protein
MFECPGCGGHFGTAEMCDDCGVCHYCCEPGCACDGCLAGRADY